MSTPKLIYLDHNATTPTRPEVFKAMEPFYKEIYGNASSLHQKGRQARAGVEEARGVIGDSLETEAVDVIFTSGGTESDNLAIKGIGFKNKSKGDHIITSSIEHLAVLETCAFMEAEGFKVSYLPVDEYGMVDPNDVEKAITDKTVLVSVMQANNEVGTIQPVAEIAEIIRAFNKRRAAGDGRRTYLHTDAVQSFGKIPVSVEDLGVDLLSVSAHKICGPKGVGALYIRKGTQISPGAYGGHHERNLRAGTENVPGIVGFGKAVELSRKNFKANEGVKRLRDRLYKGLTEKIRDIKLNGHLDKRLPNTLNIGFKYIEGESLLINFDLRGIFASTGSACTSGSVEGSHVLKAMGADALTGRSTVRFSLGPENTDADIDYCLEEIPKIVKRLRSILPLTH